MIPILRAVVDSHRLQVYDEMSDVRSYTIVYQYYMYRYTEDYHATYNYIHTQVALRQLLRQLSKDKAEFEWQLRDCEWRLDQEAAVSLRWCIL